MTPDLYEGEIFASLADGVDYALRVGFGEIIARGAAAVTAVESPVVVVGMSLGALPAQYLAQTDRRIAGAVLVGACIPLGEFADNWQADVAVEVHAAVGDAIFDDDGDADAAEQLSAQVPTARVVRHPNGGHLCCERGHPDFSETTTAAVIDAIASMTAAVGTSGQ